MSHNIWHEPAAGLNTVDTLLAELHSQPQLVDDASAVSADLERIGAALNLAAEDGIQFALLVEVGNGTNQLVWEIREAYP